MKDNIKEYIFPISLLIIVTAFFSFSTNFFILSDGTYSHDAGIFAYDGWAMSQGRVLYTEVWENKGPLLYFLNMVGVLINYHYGMYFIEFIFIFIAMFFAYKTAMFFAEKNIAVFSVVFSFAPLVTVLERGNLSEEYALLFLSLGLYLVVKFLFQNFTLTKKEMMVVGACCGGVLMLRGNIIAMFLAILLVLAFVLLKRGMYRKLGEILLFSLLGCALFCLPFLIYLGINGALGEYLNIAWFNAIGEFIELDGVERLTSLKTMLYNFNIAYGLCIAAAFFVVVFLLEKKSSPRGGTLTVIAWCLLAYFFINLYFNSLSGCVHMHYFMTFIPLLTVPSAYLFGKLGKLISDKAGNKRTGLAVVVVLVIFLTCGAFFTQADNILTVAGSDYADYDSEYNLLDNYIVENTDEDDLLQNCTNGSLAVTANYRVQRLSSSRYSYFAAGNFTEEAKTVFAKEIIDDMFKNPPTIMLFSSPEQCEQFGEYAGYSQRFDEWLNNNYEIADIDGVPLLVYEHK